MNKIQKQHFKRVLLSLTVIFVMLFSVMTVGANVFAADDENSDAAKIGNISYQTLSEAFAAARDGDTIKLLTDISLSETIKNTQKVTLDLNGKTITGIDKNTSGNFYLFNNVGELTVTGNGTITLTAENNRGWNASSVVIANNPGGKLVIENGTIEHLGGTDMAYAIDNLTNGKGTYAETVINGGTIKSTYRAIRQFLNGTEAQNILTINGGVIEGENKAIFIHDPSANANTGEITITENAVIKGEVYIFVTEGSSGWSPENIPISVSISNEALKNGTITQKNLPKGYVLENRDGIWGIYDASYVAQIGETKYYFLQAAINAALENMDIGENVTIFFLVDIEENVTIGSFVDADGNPVTDKILIIDGADFAYTGTMTVAGEIDVTVQNVNFVNGGLSYPENDAETDDPSDHGTIAVIAEHITGFVTGGSLLYACLATNGIVKNGKRKKRNTNAED